MHSFNKIVLLALCLTLASTCSFDDDVAYNRCGFMQCWGDAMCSTGSCIGFDLLHGNDGYC